MTSNSKILLAFLAGGAIGAGVALLTAPASGAETRKRIKETVDEAGKRVRESVEEAKLRLDEKTVGLQRAFTDRKEGLKNAYAAGKDAYNAATVRVAE